MADRGRNGEKSASRAVVLARMLQLLCDDGVLEPSRKSPIVRFQHPHKLQGILSLEPGQEGLHDNELLQLCHDAVSYSVQTCHPYFKNQLYGGTDPYGLAGAWLAEALNTNIHTYEVAPVFVLVECAVLQRVLKIVGFSDGDGIFSPGGSISNMYGMVLARYKAVPECKTKGLSGQPPLVAFTSEAGHYSVKKCAHWLGLGTENVIPIKTDSNGRMMSSDLNCRIQQTISEGKKPFFVSATAGTTVLGAFDPLEEISDVCRQYGLWLHVDACWGGTLMLSKKHCHRLKGLDRVNSVAWNPHKMLGAPLQCSLFLTREKGLMQHCNSASASYLFQQDKFYDVSYDTGDMSVQCGRKVDAFKLWLMWKARGDDGFEALINNAMDASKYFKERIQTRPGFRLVQEEFECTNICFWFIPPSLRDQEENEEWWDKIHAVAPKIKESLILAGTLMISYQPLPHKGYRNFFRFVTSCHPPATHADMDHVWQEIERHGANM
ncbi:acidic amino acid decarboxylase GADL1-like [Periplaneta americana]|uniref:acidic amino acid decarboxylase GADL1-like n=1 Tax=Periplaneta americana TaxID=6978 RepID=UPI0037E96D42